MHAPNLYRFSTQHCITLKMYFSLVSGQNSVYHPRYISLLFQYTTLCINTALLLTCFNTQHFITFSHVSVQNTVCHPRPISLLLQYTILYTPTLYFSPVSVQNTVYHSSSISFLFQYTTLHISSALFLPCFSTQHCITPILYICPVSVQNPVYGQRSIPLPFPYISLYITPSQFLPYSVHKTVYYPPSLSILLQYTTLFVTHALYHSCFST